MCVDSLQQGRMKEAQDVVMKLWAAGYAATDIIQTLFKVRFVPIRLCSFVLIIFSFLFFTHTLFFRAMLVCLFCCRL